jgi:hypothetical protein
MKLRMLVPAISLSLLLAATAASANDNPRQTDTRALVDAQTPLTQVDTAIAEPRPCVRQTGTRIARQHCQPGRAYTREDIDRTGATNMADALRMLDPAITIRR